MTSYISAVDRPVIWHMLQLMLLIVLFYPQIQCNSFFGFFKTLIHVPGNLSLRLTEKIYIVKQYPTCF